MILLFSMPRSGSSWVGKILDSHPDTVYRHEPDTVTKLNSVHMVPEVAHADLYGEQLAEFFTSIEFNRHEKVTASLPIFPKRYYSDVSFARYKYSCFATKACSKYLKSNILSPQYIPRQGSSRTVVWKSIESLGRLGLFAAMIPSAKPVHLVRHPCGHVNSVMTGEQSGKFQAKNSVADNVNGHQLILDCTTARDLGYQLDDIREMSYVERLTLRWLILNEKAYLDNQNYGTVAVYERICAEPLVESEKLLKACGLTMDTQVEAFIAESTSCNDEGYYAVKKDPLTAANSWQTNMSQEDQGKIKAMVINSNVGKLFF